MRKRVAGVNPRLGRRLANNFIYESVCMHEVVRLQIRGRPGDPGSSRTELDDAGQDRAWKGHDNRMHKLIDADEGSWRFGGARFGWRTRDLGFAFWENGVLRGSIWEMRERPRIWKSIPMMLSRPRGMTGMCSLVSLAAKICLSSCRVWSSGSKGNKLLNQAANFAWQPCT
jgi:hypothetical protein